MYVRTKKGEIFDCYESEQMHKPIYYPKKSKTNGYIDYEDVYKKSDNLIDILQVGDYVNGVEVENIDDEWITMSDTKVPILKSIANGLIVSILTKEQFKEMEYRIGDD